MSARPDAFDDSTVRAVPGAGREDARERGETAALREQIEDTRSRMSDTLDQLGERLNPRAIKEQVKDNIREATVGRVKHMARQATDQVVHMERSLMRTARENPIPTAMIGIGLAWLVMNRRRERHDEEGRVRYYGTAPGMTEYDEAEGYVSETVESYEGTGGVKHGLQRVRQRAADLGETIKEKASELGHKAQDAASGVGEKTQQVTHRITDATKRAAGAVSRTSRRQAQRVEEKFYDNPLAIGALVLAAGFAIGMTVKATDAEVRFMGDASDQLADRARDAVRDTKDKVQHVAERVIDEGKRTAQQAMREEGLTSA